MTQEHENELVEVSDEDDAESTAQDDNPTATDEDEQEDEKFPLWLRKWAPTAAFFMGFVFDTITLGRRVGPLDLVLIGTYALLAYIALYLGSRYFSEKTNKMIQIATQFFVGGMFSALVVLYFKSAAGWYSLLFVLSLVGFMLWNEFFHKRETQRELIWGVYSVCLIMTLNFIFPHLFKSISPFWFYLSTGCAFGFLVLLQKLAKYPAKVLRTTITISLILVTLFTFGWIPPVPLVMKNTLVCVDFERIKNEYTCNVEIQPLLSRLGIVDQSLHPPSGGPVHVLTAIFAPSGINVKMEHRWFHKTKKGWKQTDALKFVMKGGRKGGWRYHTRKRNIAGGKWRVSTALQGGAVLGYVEFDVGTEEPTLYKRERQSL